MTADSDFAAVGNQIGKASVDGHESQRHDKRLQFRPGDDQAHEQLKENRHGEASHNHGRLTETLVPEQEGHAGPEEAHHLPHR